MLLLILGHTDELVIGIIIAGYVLAYSVNRFYPVLTHISPSRQMRKIIRLIGLAAIAVFVAYIAEVLISNKNETVATVIDCRHSYDGRYAKYVVALRLKGQLVEHKTDSQYKVGDRVRCRYYYSRLMRGIQVIYIQKIYHE